MDRFIGICFGALLLFIFATVLTTPRSVSELVCDTDTDCEELADKVCANVSPSTCERVREDMYL